MLVWDSSLSHGGRVGAVCDGFPVTRGQEAPTGDVWDWVCDVWDHPVTCGTVWDVCDPLCDWGKGPWTGVGRVCDPPVTVPARL